MIDGPRRLAVREILSVVSGGSSRPLRVATDEGIFILKLAHGAEGPRALAAEWIATSLASIIALPTLELFVLDLDPRLAKDVGESELREAIERGAAAPCLGSRELRGARPARREEIEAASDDFALRLLWLDVLVENPDRRSSNPNILMWGASLVPIDHASALPFHHDWDVDEARPGARIAAPADHVFAARRARLAAIAPELDALVTREAIDRIAGAIPEEWLGPIVFETPARQRAAYAAYVWKRARSVAAHGAFGAAID